MDKKYTIDLTQSKTVRINGKEHILHRVCAVRDIHGDSIVNAGDYGGWVENETNLSQQGACWIKDEAMVFDRSAVCGTAIVGGSATVKNRAYIYGDALVRGHAIVQGKDTMVCDRARISGYATVSGGARVGDDAEVEGKASVYGKDTCVFGETFLSGDARVRSNRDYITVSMMWGTRCDIIWLTCYRDKVDDLVWDSDWLKKPMHGSALVCTCGAKNPKLESVCRMTVSGIECAMKVAAN